MSYYDFNITLFRDSLSTPWGFRLEGGRDYQNPLAIQRVFTGSPASGELQRGDVITSIQNRDSIYLLHQEANDLIRSSGGSLHLGIRRSSSFNVPSAVSGTPHRSAYVSQMSPSSMAQRNTNLSSYLSPSHLYSSEDPIHNYIRSRPIEKSRDPKPILSQTGSPIMPGCGTSSSASSVSIKRYRPFGAYSSSPLVPHLPKTNFAAHNLLSNSNATAVPYGTDRHMLNQLSSTLSRVNRSHQTQYGTHSPTRQAPSLQNYSAYSVSTLNLSSTPPDSPAWAESLRRTSHVDPFGHHHHNINNNNNNNNAQPYSHATPMSSHSYRVGGQQSNSPVKVFSQHEASDMGGSQQRQLPKGPRIANIQYNSPIGLYSNANIEEEFYKKIGSQSQSNFGTSSEF